jgi:hypothetical protein
VAAVANNRTQHEDGDARRHGEVREVEGGFERALPTLNRQRNGTPRELGDEQLTGCGEEEAQD